MSHRHQAEPRAGRRASPGRRAVGLGSANVPERARVGRRAGVRAAWVAACAFVVVTALAVRAPAEAQTRPGARVSDPLYEDASPLYVPAFRPAVRFTAGFDFGLGVMQARCALCDGTLGGASVAVWAGVQVTPRMVIALEVWSLIHPLGADANKSGVLAHTLATPAARVWFAPTLWVQAGIGAGVLGETTTAVDEYAFAPGMAVAVGGELKHRPGSAIELALRFGAARYADSDGASFALLDVAATVGWRWY